MTKVAHTIAKKAAKKAKQRAARAKKMAAQGITTGSIPVPGPVPVPGPTYHLQVQKVPFRQASLTSGIVINLGKLYEDFFRLLIHFKDGRAIQVNANRYYNYPTLVVGSIDATCFIPD